MKTLEDRISARCTGVKFLGVADHIRTEYDLLAQLVLKLPIVWDYGDKCVRVQDVLDEIKRRKQ